MIDSFSDGEGGAPGLSYSDNLDCMWTVLAQSASELVELNVSVARIWANDALYVYAGNSTDGDLLATITGIDRHWPSMRAKGALTVTFVTDANRYAQPLIAMHNGFGAPDCC